MIPSLEKMKIDMELRGFSPKTVTVYLKSVQVIANSFSIQPHDLTYDQIRDFLHHAISVRKLSRSYVNTTYNAIKFFFETTLGKEWSMKNIPRVKKGSKLPVALSPEQVNALFNATTNLKHKTMLMTCYSAGLRVGELLNLKVSDINSNSMKIRVQSGKGLKERYTILSIKNLHALRTYYKTFKPHNFLFTNSINDKPLNPRTIQQVFSDKRDLLGFPKDATLHSLRHSFATHLLLSDTDIVVIQKLLGHTKIATTALYLHLTTADIAKVTSPMDSLDIFHV